MVAGTAYATLVRRMLGTARQRLREIAPFWWTPRKGLLSSEIRNPPMQQRKSRTESFKKDAVRRVVARVRSGKKHS